MTIGFPTLLENVLHELMDLKASGAVESTTTEYDGSAQHSITYSSDNREIELIQNVERQLTNYYVVGRIFGRDHGCDVEEDILETRSEDDAVKTFLKVVSEL